MRDLERPKCGSQAANEIPRWLGMTKKEPLSPSRINSSLFYNCRDIMNTGVEMSVQKGTLTRDQVEIMKVIWAAERPLTAAEIWQELTAQKQTARTTVVTLVK